MDGRIFQLRIHLSEKLNHRWTVEEMASCFELSVPHFRKLFKKTTGSSPTSYLRDQRLEKARELLESTFYPIKRIGLTVGMTNRGHFTRDFKEKYGSTPTEHRRKHNAKIQVQWIDGTEMIPFGKK